MLTFFDNGLSIKRGLRHVVYEHFLKSAVVPLCGLIVLMLLLYFSGTYYTYQISLSEMRERAKSTVTEIARSETRNLKQKLQEVVRNTTYLKTVTEHLFQDNSSVHTNYEEPKLQHSDNSILYRDMSSMMDGSTIYGSSLPSSLYISKKTEVNQALKHRLYLTEALDRHFQRIVDNNPDIHSAYFNSWDKTNRLYPPIASASKLYRSGQQASLFEGYNLADEKNNPEREAIWTAIHPDSQGRDWVLSNMTPIYHHGFMEGVIGVNVNLSEFTAGLLSTPLIWDSMSLITDMNGNVLGQSTGAKELLGITTLQKKYTQGDNTSLETNLFHHKAFNGSDIDLTNLIRSFNQTTCCLHISNQEYLISQQKIDEIDWRLIILTPINSVTQQVTRYQEFINNLGIYFVLLAAIFFTLFFIYLKSRAIRLAKLVSTPVEVVTEYISRLNKLGNNKPLPVMQVGIKELDRLIDSSAEIQQARSRLSLLNQELEQKNYQLRTLAITDQLTGLYNRHKLDEIITREIQKAKRYNNHFSVALLDIDYFKRVNDTHGHQVGDSILVGVSAIMRRRVRETDVVGRWGGEEFIIMLPNTSLKQAATVLDELRKQLAHSDFTPVKSLTVSLGLAGSDNYPTEDSIIAAADEALYQAKKNGRNRLEIAFKQIKTHAPTTAEAI